jgi:triphosphoribosyl-dephospho-CoA synthase
MTRVASDGLPSSVRLEPESSELLRASSIGAAAQLACLLEASAPKPGNVSPGRHFADARYEHFLASAAAIGHALDTADQRSIGATILRAVEDTARWSRSNTNLGLVLLLAPLARAAMFARRLAEPGVTARDALRTAVRRELSLTTVADARDAYAAIRRARPGGLGDAPHEDVAGEPTVSLLAAMRLAADRDGVAHEYHTAFETTFTIGAPALDHARAAGLSWDDAVSETFLTLLATLPDTHVARRAGLERAREISGWARAALDAGGVRSAAGRETVARMDDALRTNGNVDNPGTTADLTAASIFVVLLGGGWHVGAAGATAPSR